MSTGQLRVRIRAYDREQAWAPPYVANELAGTRQAADKHRQDAAVRRAEADAATNAGDDTTSVQRQREAEDAQALAATLDARAAELEHADEARAHWYAHTAETRAAADRARAELSVRAAAGAAGSDEHPAVTAEEWLAAHHAAERAEDPHREITTEHDLTDITATREHDQRTAQPQLADTDSSGAADATADDAGTAGDTARAERAVAVLEPELAPRDIRQEAADEPDRDDGHDPDNVRVPSSEETAESVRRAQRALAELRQRQAIEEQRAVDEARERDDELARWHTDQPDGSATEVAREPDGRSTDRSADSSAANDAANNDDTAADAGPVLEVTSPDDY